MRTIGLTFETTAKAKSNTKTESVKPKETPAKAKSDDK